MWSICGMLSLTEMLWSNWRALSWPKCSEVSRCSRFTYFGCCWSVIRVVGSNPFTADVCASCRLSNCIVGSIRQCWVPHIATFIGRYGIFLPDYTQIQHDVNQSKQLTALLKNIEKHLLPQFVNTIQIICLQNVNKINLYFYKTVHQNTWALLSAIIKSFYGAS